MVRTPCCDKNGLRKGTWTPEEDGKLMAYVTKYGYWNWRQLPKYAGLSRCGKSCRLRWMNYLRPNIKRGNYTKDEEDTILRLHESLGNRWSAIAAHLPGRTDNEIKNHWHTNLKKRMQKDSVSKKQKQYRSSHPKKNQLQQENTEPNVNLPVSTTATSQTSFSPKPSSSSDISSSMSTSESKSDDEFAFFEAYQEPSGNFWTEPFLADYYCMPSEFFTPSLDPLSPFLDEEIIWSYSLCEKHGEWNL